MKSRNKDLTSLAATVTNTARPAMEVPAAVLPNFSDQIEYLNFMGKPGKTSLETFHSIRVLIVGVGPCLHHLFRSLISSGLQRVRVICSDSDSMDNESLHGGYWRVLPDLWQKAEGHEPALRDEVREADYVLTAAYFEDDAVLQVLSRVCRKEGKPLFPVRLTDDAGIAGPWTLPNSPYGWESAWRSLHDKPKHSDAPPCPEMQAASVLLANTAGFELFKAVTGTSENEFPDKFYLLDPLTLESGWHSYLPHPMIPGNLTFSRVDFPLPHDEPAPENPDENQVYDFFAGITSPIAGIFRIWEPGNLKQLPLTQCRVQPFDPLPAENKELLLPLIGCGLTHESAAREAGLLGLESYAARLLDELCGKSEAGADRNEPPAWTASGIGAGETLAEAVCRGLTNLLERKGADAPTASEAANLEPGELDDPHARFLLHALRIMGNAPLFVAAAPVLGFPAVRLEIQGQSFRGTGLNLKLAVRNACMQALQHIQNQPDSFDRRISGLFPDSQMNGQGAGISAGSSGSVGQHRPLRTIPPFSAAGHARLLDEALQTLKKNGMRLTAVEFNLQGWGTPCPVRICSVSVSNDA